MKRNKDVSLGTAFENRIKTTCDAYRAAGIAMLEKVEPPTKTLHQAGGRKRTIYLANPFLDFIGTWTARGGQTILLEAKWTSTPTLKIGEDNGIKLKQLENAIKWRKAGAAVAFLWGWNNETRIVSPAAVAAQLTFRKSLRWCDATPLPQGPGFIFIDFLAILARLHPQPKTTTHHE